MQACWCGGILKQGHHHILSDKQFAEKFWAKFNKSAPAPSHMPELGNCWEWRFGKFGSGNRAYGAVSRNGKTDKVHRVAYELAFGPIPTGMKVMHKCDNPPCGRPDHLCVGTDADNIHDRDTKGRTARGNILAANSNRARGERVNTAKLTADKVRHIKELIRAGNSDIQIAVKYDVSAGSIWFIRNGKHWAHIT